MARSPLMNRMVKAADKAARGLRHDFSEIEYLQVTRKGAKDFVTNADLAAEQTIREELAIARPDFGFLMEESGASGPVEKRWVVDPLDGTTNFIHGIPHFAINIAIEVVGQIVAAVTYDPIKDEMFTAEKGGGAFLNGRRLRVSAREILEESVIAFGRPLKDSKDMVDAQARLGRVTAQVGATRRQGSAALDLAYVAAGRYEGLFEGGLKPWDLAAGMLLVKEAGGSIQSRNPDESILKSGEIIASNSLMHANLCKLLEVKSQPATK
jgi:myo-inositol-1(or 4)-monophosphatase